MKYSLKKLSRLFVVSLLCVAIIAQPVLAATKSDLQKQQKEAQNKLNDANKKIDNMKDEQDEIQNQIEEIDQQLVELIASVELIEEEVKEKEEQIAETQKEYEAAKAKEEEQYAAMKLRIKFMYEQGDSSYMELLMSCRSYADLLNKADYVNELYEYDRKLLLEYVSAKEAAEELWNQLEDEKSALEAQQHELEEEKKELEKLEQEKQAEFENYENLIAKAKQEAAAYKTQIKQATAAIKKIEEEEAARKKAEEEARKKAEKEKQKKEGGGGDSDGNNSGGGNDVYIPPSPGNPNGQSIANYACQFIGNPYVAGGTSLTNGADCSGFVWRVYKDFGYSVPRTSSSLRSVGTEVGTGGAQPGDIVCYAGHVGIYIGNGTIVHASTERTGIRTTSWTYKPILAVRRVV